MLILPSGKFFLRDGGGSSLNSSPRDGGGPCSSGLRARASPTSATAVRIRSKYGAPYVFGSSPEGPEAGM